MSCSQPFADVWVCRSGKLEPTTEVEWKWCHKCRLHAQHNLFLLIAEWYDPEPSWHCPNCDEDHTGWNW